MIQTKSWEITDEFWEEVKDLIPEKQRDPNKEYKRAAGGGRPPMDSRKILEAIFYVLRTGIQWKPYRRRNLERRAQYIGILWHGVKQVYLKICGRQDLKNIT
jgi:transposase